jgi:SRSO17 transposase
MSLTCDYRRFFQNGKKNIANQARSYLSGLVMEAPRKNIERMEEFVEGCDYESTQYFISESTWDHRIVLDEVARDTNKLFSDSETALILDESGFQKKGKMSVGVARQYNGRLGKIDNCQVGVFAALSDGVHSGLIDARLYLPVEWTNDPARCDKAKIPESERIFRTKIELAEDMILRAKTMDLKFDWVCFDAFYGAAPALLKTTDQLGLIFIADVRSNQHVECCEKPDRIKGQINELFSATAKNEWENVRIEYLDGPKSIKAARQRVVLYENDDGTIRTAWAVCIFDPEVNERSYFLTNCAADVPLRELVRRHTRRYWIERCFQDGKSSLGMADYQVRGWGAWHHHMAMVALAQRFILEERKVHCKDISLLSTCDVVAALTVLIPRKDTTIEEVLGIIQRRHKKRQAARNSERKHRINRLLR